MLFIEDGAPVIVQGMTGHQGMTHTAPVSYTHLTLPTN